MPVAGLEVSDSSIIQPGSCHGCLHARLSCALSISHLDVRKCAVGFLLLGGQEGALHLGLLAKLINGGRRLSQARQATLFYRYMASGGTEAYHRTCTYPYHQDGLEGVPK